MIYNVSFRAKLEGVNQWVSVGDEWITFTSDTASMIKEVCGSYPSQWDGRKCSDMYEILMQGVSLLSQNPEKYRPMEARSRWGTVEQTRDFIKKIADNCARFPTATIDVIG